ncbi:hypothetical protein [Kosakonia sacchari]|uniref:hypothetical protein n=1 Tax=Kosakonia sacchari TaxID=1158459 RepID=UPI001584744E|nr:hypothetical protein [Kosakonia sacchari]NUL36118.1 hypothetical protein [Kosakonia sacchari]
MTNRAKQKKAWGYQCKSEPIKQRDNNDGVLNRQPTILATGNSVKHDSWSFALRLLHDQTRNVTLPESTDQCLPNLPLNSQPYTISFMDIPMLYRPDLAVSPLNWQLFFTSAAAFYPDDPPREAPEAFVNTDCPTSGLLVDKTTTWQRLYTFDILKPGMNQDRQFARMSSIQWCETAPQPVTTQHPGAQFAYGFFWPTLFCQEK